MVAAGVRAEGPTPSGVTGLATVPTAEVQPGGSGRLLYSNSNPLPERVSADNYGFSLGLLPGFEMGGRIVETGYPNGIRDLSFNAKYRLDLPWGAGLALGVTDYGGKAPHFRSKYAAATLPWQTLRFTAAYGTGPDILKGAFGGAEWRPWPYAALVAEHDTQAFNAGAKLNTGPLLGRLRVGADAIWRGHTHEVEYEAHVEWDLSGASVIPSEARDLLNGSLVADAPRDDASRPLAPLGVTLRELGFEAVRVGKRGSVQVVALENRVYNHSAADGIAVALHAIARRLPPELTSIELTQFAYGVPQVTVSTDRSLTVYDVINAAGIPDAGAVAWDEGSTDGLRSAELVLEPLLRTFVATEYGLLDYGLALRPRVTVPLGGGALFNVGAQLPIAHSDDFAPGQNFDAFAPRAGVDTLLVQYAHKVGPDSTWLWSAGHTRVFNADLNTLALEQLWLSPQGQHQLRTKLMTLLAGSGARNVAVAGYTWSDPAHAYSLGVSGGRYYAGDRGWRLDFSRYFGDTICTLFLKVASAHDQAAGVLLTLPLTPRRDAQPTGLQVKGPRRWGHSLSTTINDPTGTNPLRPALLYEPSLDLDLRRDFYDAGRLTGAGLQVELPQR